MTQNRMINQSVWSRCAALVREFLSVHRVGVRNVDGFSEVALEIFKFQFQNVIAYRRFCEGRGAMPDNVRDWRDIPAIPTDAFKDFELSCLPKPDRSRVFHSSGTTEQRPSRHYHNAESLALYEASLLAWFEAHLLGPGGCGLKWLMLTPSAKSAPHSSLAHMLDTAARKFGGRDWMFAGRAAADGAWDLDVEATIHEMRLAAAESRPVLLIGTAFNFVHLLDALQREDARIRLPEGSRAMETGGYKGRSRAMPRGELHAQITARLGLRPELIISEYGMSELSSQAYDRAHGDPAGSSRTFRFPPWARVRIVSPETGREAGEGETGLIQVFDLANVFSVMAVQTSDLGVRRGRGFELIGRAQLTEPRGCSLMSV
jgi:hypothetical protein